MEGEEGNGANRSTWHLQESEGATVHAPAKREIVTSFFPAPGASTERMLQSDLKNHAIEELTEYETIVNKLFSSEDDGFKFYNEYAKEKGFSIRKEHVRHDRISGSIVYRRFVCSRAGYRAKKFLNLPNRTYSERALTRCGCGSQLAIELNSDQRVWFVTNFVDEHNHPLATQDQVSFLWSHRAMTDAQKANVAALEVAGLRKHTIIDVMENQHGGYDSVGYIAKDLYNFSYMHKKGRIRGGDAETVLNYMRARQDKDADFFFKFETDDQGRLKYLFWSDAQSRLDYQAFGDVVVFDSTYRVNKYNLPFIPFVGINHHRSTVIFGCGIVSNEAVKFYEWLLRTFMMAMCQEHPKSVITDGDNAMKKAIKKVLPTSDHRLCTWHIEQNLLRHLHSEAMHKDFRAFLYKYSEDEFDEKWSQFKEKYQFCDKNLWLTKMYKLRKMWSEAFLVGKYFLGMRSNQRSESLNSRLHRNLDRKMTLVDLLEHYEHCLSRMRRNEVELDSKAAQSVPFTQLDADPIEKASSLVFTPKNFQLVKKQFDQAKKCAIIEIIDDCDAEIYEVVEEGIMQNKLYVHCVVADGNIESIRCSCLKMECEGIPCSHILIVLKTLGFDCIPSCCVSVRLTMMAKSAFPSERKSDMYNGSDILLQYHALCNKGHRAFMKAARSKESLQKLNNVLDEILRDDAEGGNHPQISQFGPLVVQCPNEDKAEYQRVLDPDLIVSKGAPKKGLKAFHECRKYACGHCKQKGHSKRTCRGISRKKEALQ